LALPNFAAAKRGGLERLAGRLIHPREQIAARRNALGLLAHRLAAPLPATLRENLLRVENFGARLGAVSYEAVLARGFALVTTPKGAPVVRADSVAPAADLKIRFADGEVAAKAGARQGSLFN
jgi:exodeoxyribonuclease VII large subunit